MKRVNLTSSSATFQDVFIIVLLMSHHDHVAVIHRLLHSVLIHHQDDRNHLTRDKYKEKLSFKIQSFTLVTSFNQQLLDTQLSVMAPCEMENKRKCEEITRKENEKKIKLEKEERMRKEKEERVKREKEEKDRKEKEEKIRKEKEVRRKELEKQRRLKEEERQLLLKIQKLQRS